MAGVGQACCGKQGTGVCPKDGHQPLWSSWSSNPALRQPEVGGEQEERKEEVHWHFPDQHRSLGSVIRWMCGVWSKVYCSCRVESWWMIEGGRTCRVSDPEAHSFLLTEYISSLYSDVIVTA